MEILSGQYVLNLSAGAFPLSTDSMVLADFIKPGRHAAVLDLGSGCGTLGLLLCAKDPTLTVTGIERSPSDHAQALENIRANHLETRLYSVCADLRTFPPEGKAGSFSCCMSNPPYFSGGEASRKYPAARRDDFCSPRELCRTAAKALRFGGDFFLVHRPEKLAQLCFESASAGMEPKRLRLVRHRPGDPVSIILLQCRKGGKPGLILEEMILKNPDGSPTSDYRRIYHL